MTDILENWVKLVPGIEKRLRFSGGSVQQRQITDPMTNMHMVNRRLINSVSRSKIEPWLTIQGGI